jgi:hypothetical protein
MPSPDAKSIALLRSAMPPTSSSAGGQQISAIELRLWKIYNFREGVKGAVYKCFKMTKKYLVAPAVLSFTNS